MEVLHALGQGLGGAVIADPGLLRKDAFESVVAVAAKAGAGMMLYTQWGKASAFSVVGAARLLPVEVVFYDSEDHPSVLKKAMRSLLASSASALLLNGIAERLQRLREPLASTCIGILGGRPIPHFAREVLTAGPGHPRTKQRWSHDAALKGISEYLRAVRLAAAWESLGSSTSTLERLAEQYGFPSARTLHDECVHFTGLAPRRAAKTLQTRAFVERVLAQVKERAVLDEP
jgi:AraC-like DNA-binding protein